jgi:hypothetical protein
VDLVYDINTVLTDLRRDPYLLGEHPDIVYRVVGGGIEFMNVI